MGHENSRQHVFMLAVKMSFDILTWHSRMTLGEKDMSFSLLRDFHSIRNMY